MQLPHLLLQLPDAALRLLQRVLLHQHRLHQHVGRIAHARYQADLGITGANAFAGAGSSGGTTIIINGDINSDADSVDALAEDAKREAARERGKRNGNSRPPRGWDP